MQKRWLPPLEISAVIYDRIDYKLGETSRTSFNLQQIESDKYMQNKNAILIKDYQPSSLPGGNEVINLKE